MVNICKYLLEHVRTHHPNSAAKAGFSCMESRLRRNGARVQHEIEVKRNTGSPDLITWSNNGPGRVKYFKEENFPQLFCAYCVFSEVFRTMHMAVEILIN